MTSLFYFVTPRKKLFYVSLHKIKYTTFIFFRFNGQKNMFLLSNLNIYSDPSVLLENRHFDYFSGQVEKNVLALTEYKKRTFIFTSSNLLLSIFRVLPISEQLELNSQVIAIYNRGLEAVQSIGLTTPYKSGKDHYQVIFSGDIAERWIAHIDDYRDPKPVRCVYHPYSSLNYWIDEPPANIPETKIAIFTVNISALAYSFRKKLLENDDYTVIRFIREYILSAIIRDIVSISIFNQYVEYNMYTLPPKELPRSAPYWYDLHDRLQRAINSSMYNILRSISTIVGISSQILLLKKYSLSDALISIPKMPLVKSLTPEIIAMELPYVVFISDICDQSNRIDDRDFNSKVVRTLRTLTNDKSIMSSSGPLNHHINYYRSSIDDIRIER